MFERLRDAVVRLFRVPAQPSVPAGGRVIRVFRASPNYYRYRLVFWAGGQLAALAGLVLSLIFIPMVLEHIPFAWLRLLIGGIEVVAWLTFLVQIPVGLAVLHLDLDLRWYILLDRSLRIREGIVKVREKTVTFANIQHISIRQNPIQRLLGIADVQVRTAGGGAGGSGSQHGQVGESMHEAYFRGVDNADEIRDAVRERVRLYRDAGLGDPDEPLPPLAARDSLALDAAREVLTEVRKLREDLILTGPSAG